MLADDLVQEAYSRAVKSGHTLRDVDRADAWIIRIMHRVYLDYLKSTQRRELPVDDIDGEMLTARQETWVNAGPEQLAMARQRERRVREAVAALPVGQRQVLTLVDLEGMSYGDCAGVLGLPVGTVMSRLSRARAALRRRLERELGPEATCAGVRLRRVK